MIHEPELIDRLRALKTEPFAGTVFRATGLGADPIAASTSGGRWSPAGVRVLYTSFERDGALAEVVSYLSGLTPLPSKPLRVHRLAVTTKRTPRLVRADLIGLGIDLARYGERDYRLTQKIGAAIDFLDMDGLISPSARWDCENLTLFGGKGAPARKPVVVAHEDIDWQAWARANNLL